MQNPDELQLITKTVDTNSNTPVLAQVLRIALFDEYKAYETYSKVVANFGQIAPFSNIVAAEQNHIDAMLNLCAIYGITPPINTWAGKINIAPTMAENCEIGVAAEIDNIKMYDYLLSFVMEADVRDVFFRVQAASFNNHLPAFRQCVLTYNTTQNGNENPYINAGVKQEAFDLNEQLKQALGQKLGIKEIEGMLSNVGGDFLIGALGGALIGAILGGENLFKGDKQ